MTKPKRTKAQEIIQKKFKNGETSLSEDDFKKLRIKLEKGQRILGNLKISKAFFGGYNIKIVSSKKDLDGILISEKQDFLRKLVSKFDNDIFRITRDELKKFNIVTDEIYIRIGNFELEYLILAKAYQIKLKNRKLDSLGRWIDSQVTIKKIINEVKKLEDELKVVKTERALQKLIYNALSSKFHTVNTEVSIGDLKTTKIDIEVGKDMIGIELKMAKGLLKTSEKNRTIGQVTHEYLKKYAKNNLILLVGGPESLRMSREIKEMSAIVKKQKSHFYYLETA